MGASKRWVRALYTPEDVLRELSMRWLVGFASFFTPVVLVLTAAAQTPVAGAVNLVMQRVASVTLQ